MVSESAIEIVVNTVSASNALLRASRKVFRPFGISEAQFNVLQVLQDNDDQLSQRELSDILIVDRSNITGLIDRMEKAEWVKRQSVPGDREFNPGPDESRVHRPSGFGTQRPGAGTGVGGRRVNPPPPLLTPPRYVLSSRSLITR